MVDGGGTAASARMRWRALIVGLIALAAIGAGLAWIFSDKSSTSTDDAYVQADKTIVSPRVRGMVLQVVAQENRPVKAGDVLVKIDPEEYDLLIAKAQGDLMAARASEAAAKAGLARLDAEEKLAEGAVNSAETLAGPKGPSDPVLRQAFETAHGQALVAARTRGDIVASMGEATAAEFRAKTELVAAELQKSQTSVLAPAGGTVADVQATVGQMVQPGVTLMTIVGQAQPVITANFKETQIGRMHGPDRPGEDRRPARRHLHRQGREHIPRLGLAVRPDPVRARQRQLHQDCPAGSGSHRPRSGPTRPRSPARRPVGGGDGAIGARLAPEGAQHPLPRPAYWRNDAGRLTRRRLARGRHAISARALGSVERPVGPLHQRCRRLARPPFGKSSRQRDVAHGFVGVPPFQCRRRSPRSSR